MNRLAPSALLSSEVAELLGFGSLHFFCFVILKGIVWAGDQPHQGNPDGLRFAPALPRLIRCPIRYCQKRSCLPLLHELARRSVRQRRVSAAGAFHMR